MVVTAPVISSTVSPRTRSAIRRPPIWEGVASPDIMTSKALAASSRVSAAPVATLPMSALNSSMARLSVGVRGRPHGAARGGERPRLRPAFPPPARLVPGRRDVEEVPQDQVPVLGRDALGMELDAVHRIVRVREPHDQPVAGLGRDGE